MITGAAKYSLKTRRQKPGGIKIQMSRTNGTGEQVRKNPGQSQHPDFEITGSEIDGTSLFQSAHGHSNQPEDSILRLVLRQKSIHEADDTAGTNRPVVILEKLHRRIQQIGSLDPHQIPVFLLEKLDSGMRQRLER